MSDFLEIIKKEPSQKYFDVRGLICEIKRHEQLGHLCGYVSIPESHPAFKKSDDQLNYSVNGGLTFSKLDIELNEWILGFDCAHGGDITPELYRQMGSMSELETYKTWEYVENEINDLVDQLLEEVSEDIRTEWEMTCSNRLAIKLLSQ